MNTTLMGQTTTCPHPRWRFCRAGSSELGCRGNGLLFQALNQKQPQNFPEVNYCRIPFLVQILHHLKLCHVPCMHKRTNSKAMVLTRISGTSIWKHHMMKNNTASFELGSFKTWVQIIQQHFYCVTPGMSQNLSVLQLYYV